ncbi:MAG: WXG100 family type VII secretion target [Ardenticatenaceae bacterium]|nr:WXG100 family type VII secretion target [Ardenticatenaceae bacterium]
MNNQIFQADYDQLAEIAKQFQQGVVTQKETMADIQRRADALVNGGWVGEGGLAFEKEMAEVITPRHRRLIDGLEEAFRVTQLIIQTVKKGEEEAALPFKGSAPAAPAVNGAGPSVNGGQTTQAQQQDRSASNSGSSPGGGDSSSGLGFALDHLIGNLIPGGIAAFTKFKDTLRSKSIPGSIGNFFTLAGFGLSGYFGMKDRMDKGMNVENAMSESFGEATTSTFTRIGLYSNPFTGIPTLIHDGLSLFGVTDDYIGKYVAKPAGKAADWTSGKISDGMVALYNNADEDTARNYPNTTLKNYQRSGKTMPHGVAQNVYMGLIYSDPAKAKQFQQEYIKETNKLIGFSPF